MVRIIESQEAILERPNIQIGARVSARYRLSAEVVGLIGQRGMNAIAVAIKEAVRDAISDSVAQAYSQSGLDIITGQLWRNATENFKVNIITRLDGSIIIDAPWDAPTIPYFFRRLFGIPGGRGFDRLRPGGYFIRFDGKARNQIAGAIRRAAQNELQKVKGLERAARIGGRRREVAEASARELDRRARARAVTRTATERVVPEARITQVMGRPPRAPRAPRAARVTPFRIRRELRKVGLSPEEARSIAGVALTRGVAPGASIADIIRGLASGRGLTTVQQPRIRLVSAG